jgi:hypothetical protein
LPMTAPLIGFCAPPGGLLTAVLGLPESKHSRRWRLNSKPRKRDLLPCRSPSAHSQPGVWLSHPERRDCRPARASEPSQNLLLSRDGCLSSKKLSAPPLRRASTLPVPKPSTPWLKEPLAPPTPREPSMPWLREPRHRQIRRPIDALAPKRWHLGLRRAFSTSTPESLGTSSPKRAFSTSNS